MSKKSHQESTFLQAVLEHPDDDPPRLAYADWLERHDQPARGEFIRLQCQLETMKEREAELLREHVDEWSRPLAQLGTDRVEFHRGFPEAIAINPPLFLENSERIAALTPIRHLTVAECKDEHLRAIAALPVLQHLQTLEAGMPSSKGRRGEFGIEGVRAVAASPILTKLKSLTLHSHGIGETGARMIAESALAKNLTSLWLNDPEFDAPNSTVGSMLAIHPSLTQLEQLQTGSSSAANTHLLKLVRESVRPIDRSR